MASFTKLILIVVAYFGGLSTAQWSTWTTSACVGISCFTGSIVRFRECLSGTCLGDSIETEECLVPCLSNVTWSEYAYGECLADPSKGCLTGRRVHTRVCEVAAPPYNKVPAENCPGGADAAELIMECDFPDCSALNETAVSNCSESCGNGYRIVTKSCNNSSPILPDCLEVLEYCNTDECENRTEPYSWGRWNDFGECSNLCSPGVRHRLRSCVHQNGTEVDNDLCTLDSYFEYIGCNEQLCNSYTEGVVVCDNICNGSYFRIRSCQDSGYVLPECIKQPMDSLCENVTADRESCGDPDIDLLFVLDASNVIDSCQSKETDLNLNSPFIAGQPKFSPANFPNFFRQKLFAVDFISRWKEVISSDTRVALKLASPETRTNCDPSFIHFLNDTGIRQLQALDYPYTCESVVPSTTASCAITEVFVEDKGDRADKTNFIVMVVPEVTGIVLSLVKQAFPMWIQPLLGNNSHLFLLSHFDPATATDRYNSHAEALKQLACFSDTPVADCDRFLGSVWDSYDDLFERFRTAVLSIM